MGYSSVDSLGVLPVLQVIVVCEDDHQVGASNEQVSPIFQAMDDGKELSVVDVIVPFHGVECLGVVSHWPFSSCLFMFLV